MPAFKIEIPLDQQREWKPPTAAQKQQGEAFAAANPGKAWYRPIGYADPLHKTFTDMLAKGGKLYQHQTIPGLYTTQAPGSGGNWTEVTAASLPKPITTAEATTRQAAMNTAAPATAPTSQSLADILYGALPTNPGGVVGAAPGSLTADYSSEFIIPRYNSEGDFVGYIDSRTGTTPENLAGLNAPGSVVQSPTSDISGDPLLYNAEGDYFGATNNAYRAGSRDWVITKLQPAWDAAQGATKADKLLNLFHTGGIEIWNAINALTAAGELTDQDLAQAYNQDKDFGIAVDTFNADQRHNADRGQASMAIIGAGMGAGAAFGTPAGAAVGSGAAGAGAAGGEFFTGTAAGGGAAGGGALGATGDMFGSGAAYEAGTAGLGTGAATGIGGAAAGPGAVDLTTAGGAAAGGAAGEVAGGAAAGGAAGEIAGGAAAGGAAGEIAGEAAGGAAGEVIGDAAGGAAGGVAGDAAGGLLSEIAKGLGISVADLLKMIGVGGATALGVAGAKEQADALKYIADKEDARVKEMIGFGAPYRSRLADIYANPSAFLTSDEVRIPVEQGTSALARALSVKGNPAGSGSALHEIQNYASNQLFGRLGQEKDRLAGFGGLTQYAGGAAQGPDLRPALGEAAANAGKYNALGWGAYNLGRGFGLT